MVFTQGRLARTICSDAGKCLTAAVGSGGMVSEGASSDLLVSMADIHGINTPTSMTERHSSLPLYSEGRMSCPEWLTWLQVLESIVDSQFHLQLLDVATP